MNMTVLMAHKDRERNLAYCLKSISLCKPIPSVVLVDFGSHKNIEYFTSCYKSWLKIIRITNNTKFFHKSRALNIGLKSINTKYFCATDVDQVFSSNFFSVVFNTLRNFEKSVVLCRTYFLRKIPEGLVPADLPGKYSILLDLAKNSGRKLSGEGCCIGLPTKWLKAVGGWDHNYVGYGAEDSDVILRAKLSGYKPIWINNRTSMIHFPHPKNTEYYSYSKYLIPNKKRYLAKRKKRKIMVKTNWNKI